MTTKHNGGPAFPITGTVMPQAPGMSLRDWFAGQALIGLLTSPNEWLDSDNCLHLGDKAYSIADRMLAARVQT